MMGGPITVLLYDPHVSPSSWSERMAEGEFAVHYSSFPAGTEAPYCSVLGSRAEAEVYARQQVLEQPEFRCTVYDHHGLAGAPVFEVNGTAYRGEREMSARFRRWVGSGLFAGGLLLILMDWRVEFRYSWPAMIGSRLIIPGLILLITEGVLIVVARRRRISGGVCG